MFNTVVIAPTLEIRFIDMGRGIMTEQAEWNLASWRISVDLKGYDRSACILSSKRL